MVVTPTMRTTCGSLLVALSVLSAQAECLAAKDFARVALAGGSITETVYFLGLQHRIVAVDSTSLYPEDAKRLPNMGYVRALSAEGVLSLNPTLVIGENDMGPPYVLQQIERTNVELVRIDEENSALGILRKVECIASVLGQAETGGDRISSDLMPLAERLAEIGEQVEIRPAAAFILSMGDGTAMAGGNSTSADGFLRMAFTQNSFVSFDGWKPVSAESLLNASPEFLVIAPMDQDLTDTAEQLRGLDAIRDLPAVQNRKYVIVESMASLGFGPRTLSTAVSVAEAIHGPP